MQNNNTEVNVNLRAPNQDDYNEESFFAYVRENSESNSVADLRILCARRSGLKDFMR